MPLLSGSRLGSYEVVGLLGAGGMGVVYRARDTRLQREVALKVLPEGVSSDPERVARFEREAQVLATFNHPNIAAIYGFMEQNGTSILAMELVEGPTLAELVERGPVPPEEALRISRQIAEALEYAHERGIIHRDLKPANIKLAPDGTVKVLDFGLAKVLESEATPRDVLSSPTLTAAATRAGIIIGTAAYMSPEQAKGKPVDRRADIWAFGCILYEMLSGLLVFPGETITDTLAAVVRAEPDWEQLPRSVPTQVQDLLKRCLRKDLRLRLQSIGDARVVLEEASTANPDDVPLQSPGVDNTPTSKWLAMLSWSLVAVLAIACVALFVARSRVGKKFPLAATLVSAPDLDLPAVSPDGHSVTFRRGNKLWIRKLDELEAHALDGTEDGSGPFWSPDSKYIGYFHDSELRTIAAAGGTSRLLWTLSPSQFFVGGTWGAGDRIVVAVIPQNSGLYEISAQGGEAKRIAQPDAAKDEMFLRNPKFLPDGKTLLLLVRRTGRGLRLDTIAVQRGTERTVVLQMPGAHISSPVFSESTGHILFTQHEPNPGIWAIQFSTSSLKVAGTSFLVASAGGEPSLSDDGTLVYLTGFNLAVTELVWVDRTGKGQKTFGSPMKDMRDPAVAPDGVRVAVDSGNYSEILVQDATRNTALAVSNPATGASVPGWSPDGRMLAFGCSSAEHPHAICLAAADGSGIRRWIETESNASDVSFTHDGNSLVYRTVSGGESGIWKMNLQQAARPEVLVSPSEYRDLRISPDGHFVAYSSDASGRREVYVRPFPAGEGRWQVSITGGICPKWNPNGKELFYLEGSKLMVVPIETRPAFKPGLPHELFSGDSLHSPLVAFGSALYDVGPDGQHFAVVRTPTTEDLSIVAIQNWLAKVKPEE